MKRLDYLDNLKVFLTVLVIFHHAGQAYLPGAGWGYHPSNPAESVEGIWRFFSINASFFMGLFFLISGYFIPQSYDKQGFGVFIWKKFLRLVIPIIAIAGLISVLTQQVDFAHLWFLQQMFVYSLFYALLRLLTKGKTISEPRKYPHLLPFIFALALVLGVVDYYVWKAYPNDEFMWVLGFLRGKPVHFVQYVTMFFLGIIAFRQNWFSRMPRMVGLITLIVGLVLAVASWFRGDNALGQYFGPYWQIYSSFMGVLLCFGLIWLFREVFDQSNQFMKWCSAQAYGAYVVHLLLMLGFQNLTDKLYLGGGIEKFLFIGLCCTILSFAFTWLLRLIPGVKKVL